MRPVDPRVLPLLTPARSALAGVVGGGVVGAGLVCAQAFAVAALISGLLAAPGTAQWHPAAWWLLAITLGRAAVGAYADLAANRAAGTVTTSLRKRVLRAAVDLEAVELSQRRSGELGLLATRGVAAVEPYLTRFLPTLVLAAVLPLLTVALILTQDLVAGVIVILTLPLVPVFAILIGPASRAPPPPPAPLSPRPSGGGRPGPAPPASTARSPGWRGTSWTSSGACPRLSPTTAPLPSRAGSGRSPTATGRPPWTPSGWRSPRARHS